jgi:molybdopterin synthase sulfur carrier subunit
MSHYTVELRFFASLREALGSQESLTLEGPTTVAAVRDGLIARGQPYAGALARGTAVRTALNQVLCSESQAVQGACELAFFPPVTGG